MAETPSLRRDLKALRNLINQADLSLTSIPNQPSIASVRENLTAALSLSKDLIQRTADPVKLGASAMGAKGGAKTAKRGPEYFAKIAAMRKTNAGGRPKKKNN